MELTVAELFAGVGGFRVGLNKIKRFDEETELAKENKTWNFVWGNQFEPSTKAQHAYNCYVKRFGIENNSNEDINKVDKKMIPDHNLLVGGFPCQDYSVARSLNGEKGIKGKKGVLFWDIKDVLIEKKSPFVLLENVDRLLKSPANRRGRDFAIMLKTFDELGYYVQWRVINAGDYSMPQKRRRVFIFAFKKNLKYSKEFRKNKENIFNKVFPVIIDSEKEINLNGDTISEFNERKTVDKAIKSGKIVSVSGTTIGHTPPGKRGLPNSVVQHNATNGDVLGRTYYDARGFKTKDIHFTNHKQPARLPYGKIGEHAHDFVFDDEGKFVSRNTRELTDDERKENQDILWRY